MKLFPIFGFSIFGVLSACGGGGGDTPELNRFEKATSLEQEIGDLPGSRFDAVPTSGRASFDGIARLGIDTRPGRPGGNLSLLGDATLTADFGAGTVTGRIDNFTGVNGSSAPTASSDRFAVDGDLRLGGRKSYIEVDPDAPSDKLRPNQFYTNYSGELRAQSEAYKIRGGLYGDFVGTRITGSTPEIRGIVTDAGDGQGTDSKNRAFDTDLNVIAKSR